MSKFILENYETVKSRKRKFYKDYNDGRINVEIIKATENETIIKASIFRNEFDQAQGLALSTGHAQEFQGRGGMANKHAWLENCEESAIGRALDNAGFFTTEKCSREEMIKVARQEEMRAELLVTLNRELGDLKKSDPDRLIEICKTYNITQKHKLESKSLVDLNRIALEFDVELQDDEKRLYEQGKTPQELEQGNPEYIIPSGTLRGKKLKDIDGDKLDKRYDYLENQFKKNGKLKDDFLEEMNSIFLYRKDRE